MTNHLHFQSKECDEGRCGFSLMRSEDNPIPQSISRGTPEVIVTYPIFENNGHLNLRSDPKGAQTKTLVLSWFWSILVNSWRPTVTLKVEGQSRGNYDRSSTLRSNDEEYTVIHLHPNTWNNDDLSPLLGQRTDMEKIVREMGAGHLSRQRNNDLPLFTGSRN